jgi:hypothetical protein
MNIEPTLNAHGFFSSLWSEAADSDDANVYRGWTIRLLAPNGGYLGIEISKDGSDEIYSRDCQLDPEHDYHDDDRLLDIARDAIDAAELACIAIDGQLNLFEEAS